jgi:hypothetical protein
MEIDYFLMETKSTDIYPVSGLKDCLAEVVITVKI